MRATVLTDAALTKHAGRFVWLSIDTENEKNAGFLEKYPWEAVPTFEVLDPNTGEIAYKWLGSVDAAQLVARFDEAERAVLAAGRPAGGVAPRTADAVVSDLAAAGKNEECARTALELFASLPAGGEKAAVAATGLDCALEAPKDAAWRAEAVAKLEAGVRASLVYPGLLDDDRSALYGAIVDARGRQDDAVGAKQAAGAWLDYLDGQVKTAANPEARAALDGYRVSAAIAAGAPERALAAIEMSERDLPNDYNPPARLAIVLREMGRYDDALAASDRALAKAYGPRKLTILDARATIYEKKGDNATMKRTLQDAVAYAATLPASQRPKGMLKRIEKRLAGG